MTRFLSLATLVFTCAVLAAPARADDPPKKLTAEERKELEGKWREQHDAGDKAYRAGKYLEAIRSFEESLKAARQLYNTTEFLDGHWRRVGQARRGRQSAPSLLGRVHALRSRPLSLFSVVRTLRVRIRLAERDDYTGELFVVS